MMPLKVQFIDDRQVLQISKEAKKQCSVYAGCGMKMFKKSEKACGVNGNDEALSLPPLDEDLQDEEIYFRPTALVGNEESKQMFGFATPNKTGSMKEKADSALKRRSILGTPSSPKITNTSATKVKKTPKTPKTPKLLLTPSGRTPRSTKSVYKTPTRHVKESSRKSLSGSFKNCDAQSATPHSFRKKLKMRIANIMSFDDSDDSDIDKDYDPSDESDSHDSDDNLSAISEEEKENETPSRRGVLKKKTLVRTPLRTPRRGRAAKVDVEMAGSTDAYFDHNSESAPCVTSDHTLSKLETPRLGPEALQSLLEGAFNSHQSQRLELLTDHVTLFPHWMTLLCEGFSIFLCGVGSKKELLSSFQSHFLSPLDHIVVNGFFPSLTIKSIISSIVDEIMDLETHPSGISDQLRLISSHYNRESCERLFLVVHNLDGPMLRNEKAQSVLSQIAASKYIHLIASFDHINAPLIFDGNQYSSYNPLWFDATTLNPYTEETSYENSLLVQQSGSIALSSLIHVFQSLTPNAKGIFLLLAEHQLMQKDNAIYEGLSFNDLYQKCRENFLVNSDLTLRAQLTEFKDHKLLKTRKGFDGAENLMIPLDPSTLQEFLDQHDEND